MEDDRDIGATAGATSDLFTADWSRLAIGFRSAVGFRVMSSPQPFMGNMQVAVLAYVSADVAVLEPKAFHLTEGILAA